MSLSEIELAQRASDRYALLIIGGDSIFLADRLYGNKKYMGPSSRMSRVDFNRYVIAINNDLNRLSTNEFFSKYSLRG
jgi:hypothetical protein